MLEKHFLGGGINYMPIKDQVNVKAENIMYICKEED